VCGYGDRPNRGPPPGKIERSPPSFAARAEQPDNERSFFFPGPGDPSPWLADGGGPGFFGVGGGMGGPPPPFLIPPASEVLSPW